MDNPRLALSMYSSGRYLFYQGAVGGPAFSHSGITAGCTFAVFILKGTMQPCMDTFYDVECFWRGTVMQIFVDDLMLLQMGRQQEVALRLSQVTLGLVKVLDYLKMPAALDKRIVVAAPALGREITKRLEGHSFKHKVIGEQLGGRLRAWSTRRFRG